MIRKKKRDSMIICYQKNKKRKEKKIIVYNFMLSILAIFIFIIFFKWICFQAVMIYRLI